MKQRFRKATGLQLTLGGRNVIRLGPRAGARIDKVSLAAPGEESFFEVDEAEAGISLLALLRGRIHVREAAVTGARLDRGDRFGRCRVRFADFRVDRVAASAPANGPVTLEASGSVSASPVTLTVTGGRLEPLLSGAEFPFQAKLEHAEAGLDIGPGTGECLWDGGHLDMGMAIDGLLGCDDDRGARRSRRRRGRGVHG